MPFPENHVKSLRRALWMVAGRSNRLVTPFAPPGEIDWVERAAAQALKDAGTDGRCPLCRAKPSVSLGVHLRGSARSARCEVITAGLALHQLHNLDIAENVAAIERLIKANPYHVVFEDEAAPTAPKKAEPAPAPAAKKPAAAKPKKSELAREKRKHIKADVAVPGFGKTKDTAGATQPADAGTPVEIPAGITQEPTEELSRAVQTVEPGQEEPSVAAEAYSATGVVAAIDVVAGGGEPEAAPRSDGVNLAQGNQHASDSMDDRSQAGGGAKSEDPPAVASVAVPPAPARMPSPADERFENAFVELLEAVKAPADEPVLDRLHHLPRFDDSFQKVNDDGSSSRSVIERNLAQMLSKTEQGR